MSPFVEKKTFFQAMGRKVLSRLTTNQRITKRDLMSADLSVISAAAKVSEKAQDSEKTFRWLLFRSTRLRF